jgi:2-polyprenyl-3-methyl-5-hydroxy-6-metoxy-1,4-benzoquinol methylase
MDLYIEKSLDYFSLVRKDLISLIPKNKSNKILEIGAGGGYTLAAIKEMGLAVEVVGIELCDMPGTMQNHPGIDRMIIGNIEDLALDFPEDHFDVIICGDVLEHLVDPWAVVNKVNKYLKVGGIWIVSMPNIREFNTLLKIIFKGDFRYEPMGILDKTHLRFFCRKNIVELLQSDNMQVQKVACDLDFTSRKGRKHIFNALTFKRFEEYLVTQYMVVSKKVK